MTLYIEYILLDNITLDYMLLGLIGTIQKRKLKKSRRILSSLIGAVFAIFLPYLVKYKVLAIVYKVMCAMLMILALRSHKTFRSYMWDVCLLFFFTFLFGGVFVGVLGIMGVEYSTNSLLLYNFDIPLGVFLLIFYIGFWLLKKVIEALNTQVKYNNFTHQITLIDNNKEVSGIGYMDSGNVLTRDGEAVSIISSELFFKLYENYSSYKFLFRNIDHSILKNASYMSIKSLSRAEKYLSFRIDKLVIDQKEYKNACVAVSLGNFKAFDCIINSQFIGEGKC